jgi:hypothetical protein
MHSKKVLKNCDLICFIIDVENLGSHSLLKQGEIVLPVIPSFRLPVPAFHLFRLSVVAAFLCHYFPVVSAISVIPDVAKKRNEKRKSVLHKSPRIFYGSRK